MTKRIQTVQDRYEGFLKTPCLWKNDAVFGMQQFEIHSESIKMDLEIDDTLRVGKYIERLVSFELKQNSTIKILSENLQIQDEKITLGEIDCLLLKDENPIHLEVIYKFYLYDSSVGVSEIDHFIGPNRKDALIEKLKKLSQKQLPLLYSKACKPYLEHLNLIASEITQLVYFKAQLFIPLGEDIMLKTLNQECIAGFYLSRKNIMQFSDCKFYIPKKIDWIIAPHTQVNWLNYNSFLEISQPYLDRQFSPLCWVKLPNGVLQKMFLVWW
ncbi:DUF1853 family protein [Algibacter miyuki]|uniref:DUF1853 family protein n=1 Tax=Algibacter miyuki TaxID=1306933 RepID=A0ABV5GW42_9FLAO|nr:DUF1853 family protein [Algibacter miyuki]MDN3665040.1 DUF1853 family protein [Algibacter miyuki]